MFRTLALLALFAAPVRADDKPKPTALTAKEIADGWVNMYDGETTFGWKTQGDVKVEKDVLVINSVGEKRGEILAATTFPWPVEFLVDWSWTGDAEAQFRFAGLRFGIPKGQRTEMLMTIVPGGVPLGARYSIVTQTRVPGGEWKHDRETSTPQSIGCDIGFFPPKGAVVQLHALKMRPIRTQKLFNGKDLTGWKVNAADPKRMASKWSVTKEGELAVKDGPGDLVCEKEFANFVLQFECKTNGKALNSGIFFRCIPGQYQNGYEAQIQNAYKDDDRTKPADFGTGAIYRRIAARKVVSNDNEWFTMTVAANGKRISTWVNGYQTVDWTDDRKDDENPRKGYRAAKGPLSIQGHDPTTDILFRNIRAGELPTK